MNQRQSKRVHFFQRVDIESHQQQYESFCLDISMRGVLLVIPENVSWQIGDKLKVIFRLAHHSPLVMICSVVHCDEDVVGCACDMMDAAAMAVLRDILEHNLEVPSKLDRDVTQLVKPQTPS